MCQRAPKSVSNTFGWARLEVISMVVNLLFLAALNFSLVVEALQTIVHADHGDVMHYPIPVCILTGVGLLINVVCIVLIGGSYLFQQRPLIPS
jgi:solute carrier family 30 (zinc transporter), member 1